MHGLGPQKPSMKTGLPRAFVDHGRARGVRERPIGVQTAGCSHVRALYAPLAMQRRSCRPRDFTRQPLTAREEAILVHLESARLQGTPWVTVPEIGRRLNTSCAVALAELADLNLLRRTVADPRSPRIRYAYRITEDGRAVLSRPRRGGT